MVYVLAFSFQLCCSLCSQSFLLPLPKAGFMWNIHQLRALYKCVCAEQPVKLQVRVV